jgi:DNA repair exonuclease SbcCD ATPase subunit
MFKELRLKNVGPASTMALDFGDRLNLITGDNGLGKSFLLDIMWWSLTRKWPAEINPRLNVGKKVLPQSGGEAEIFFKFSGKKSRKSTPASISAVNSPGPGVQGARRILGWCCMP